jgi:hypothetical protein
MAVLADWFCGGRNSTARDQYADGRIRSLVKNLNCSETS